MADRLTLEEKRRGQILSAARQAFSRKGYDAATVDEIAEAAGVSKGLIYNYFRSKEDILVGTAEAWMSTLEEDLKRMATTEVTAADKLLAVWRLTTEIMAGEWEFVQLQVEIWSELHRRPEIARRYAGMFRQFRSLLVGIIEEGIASKEFRPVAAKEAASLMIAAGDGLILQRMADQRAFTWRGVTDAVGDLLLGGLLMREREG